MSPHAAAPGRARSTDWKRTAPELTALETVTFAALMQMPGAEFSARARCERAGECLRLVGLTPRACHTRVGRPGGLNRLSGGETRRVSVALGLLHDPPVVLLDEPTSGLDSQAALSVVSVLARLAHEDGRVVVSTAAAAPGGAGD